MPAIPYRPNARAITMTRLFRRIGLAELRMPPSGPRGSASRRPERRVAWTRLAASAAVIGVSFTLWWLILRAAIAIVAVLR
jgi:hypothetical protein